MRVDRVRRIIERLAGHGIQLDAEAVLRPGTDDNGKAAGRPWIARALIAGGHVATIAEAFDRWLSRGRPAFVARTGRRQRLCFAKFTTRTGLPLLAHPGLLGRDDLIPGLAASGIDAIEAYHSKHPHESTVRYITFADRLGLAISGGSDYHADPAASVTLGGVGLPRELYEALKARASHLGAGSAGLHIRYWRLRPELLPHVLRVPVVLVADVFARFLHPARASAYA